MEFAGIPQPIPPHKRDGIGIEREILSVDAYLALYRAVGAPVQWDERLRMPRGELNSLLQMPSTHVYVLRVQGRVVGFCEFEGVGSRSVELKHFGLVPDVQGMGLGALLLGTALAAVWTHAPDCIWLHTDTQDHPRAVGVYQRAGFRVTERRLEIFED